MSIGDLKSLTDGAQAIGLLGVCIVAIWAFYTRRIVSRTTMDAAVADVKSQADVAMKAASDQAIYAEARRQEERESRIAAERRLAALVDSVEDLGEVLREVKDEVLRGTAYREGRRGSNGGT